MRPWMIRLHRYVGLGLTSFLVVIGLTGCVIAHFNDLDTAVNPDLWRVEPRGAPLSVLDLRERLAAQDPRVHVYYVHFPESPTQALSAYVEGAIDPAAGEPYAIDYDEVFADPYTGARLGERLWGRFSLNREDLITQLYFLHYSLVLPEKLGEGFMGVVALVWAFDCLVGLYLTFPRRRAREASRESKGRGFLARWRQAWRIKTGAGAPRLVYDVHRAVSLWVFAMLLVFAVSGFALNLPGAYESVLRRIAPYEDVEERPELAEPLERPAVEWAKALALGQGYMDAQARAEGFSIDRPTALIYRREHGVYYYRVHSSRDVVRYGETTVAVDGTTGALVGVEIPTGHRSGNTFTSWIKGLHMAMFGGLPWRLFVSLMGLVVVTLALTGVLIWRRKRLAGHAGRRLDPSSWPAGSPDSLADASGG
jgi:uncharacterized iron-regulated membrane protein